MRTKIACAVREAVFFVHSDGGSAVVQQANLTPHPSPTSTQEQEGSAYREEVMMPLRRATRNTVVAIVLSGFFLFSSGCGTIRNLTDKNRPEIYGGVKLTAEMIKEGFAWMADPPNFEPIGGQTSPAWGCGAVLMGILDMPLSLIGDTLLYRLIIVKRREWDRQETQHIAQETQVAEYNNNVSSIYEKYKYVDGNYVDFEEVLSSPASFKGMVLRSTVVLGYATDYDHAMRMGRLGHLGVVSAPADGSRSTTNDMRFWCSGEFDSEGNTKSWVMLDTHSIPQRKQLAEHSFEGFWDIQFTFEKNTKKPDQERHFAWSCWMNVSKEGTNLVGVMSSGPIIGTIQGQAGADGTFNGNLTTIHDPKEWESLTLTISPYGDLAKGEAVFSQEPEEEHFYSVEMMRRKQPFAR